MEMEVMKDVDIAWFPESPELVSSSMAGAIDVVFEDPTAICYTFYYYAQVGKKVIKYFY